LTHSPNGGEGKFQKGEGGRPLIKFSLPHTKYMHIDHFEKRNDTIQIEFSISNFDPIIDIANNLF
jgi:hypothetical protein